MLETHAPHVHNIIVLLFIQTACLIPQIYMPFLPASSICSCADAFASSNSLPSFLCLKVDTFSFVLKCKLKLAVMYVRLEVPKMADIRIMMWDVCNFVQ